MQSLPGLGNPDLFQGELCISPPNSNKPKVHVLDPSCSFSWMNGSLDAYMWMSATGAKSTEYKLKYQHGKHTIL